MQHRIIGITGGIASGKTTVSQYLEYKHKITVFDADLYAREAVQKGSETLAKIVTHYGETILLEDGSLNRSKLGEIIFNNLLEKEWLEKIIHPYVRSRFEEDIKTCSFNTIVLVIPLLFEAKMTDLVTETWVIYCSYEEQIERLRKRNNLSVEQSKKRIENQWYLDNKKKMADLVIKNTGDMNYLYQQLDKAILG